jgi:hypothetical protein
MSSFLGTMGGLLMSFAVLVATLMLQPAPTPGAHPPEVEQRLAFLVNDWTIEGSEAGYRETCRWYHQRSFVVCETVDRTQGAPAHSVSILGWSPRRKTTPIITMTRTAAAARRPVSPTSCRG